jgi:hypothetical protein
MRKPAIILTTLLVFSLALVAISCSGGQDSTPTPVATPTPMLTATPSPSPSPTPTPVPAPTPSPAPTTEYLIYTDAVNGFSVAYPDDWGTKTLPSILFAVESPEICRGFRPTFEISTVGLTYSTDVESFFGTTVAHLLLAPERTFIYGERVGVSGRSAIKWLSIIANTDGSNLKEMSFFLVSSTTAWTLSFRAEPYCWSQYEEIFDYMVSTFHVY